LPQGFLRNFFKVPADTNNPIFATGYTDAAKEAFRFSTIDKNGVERVWLPIIPDINPKNGRPYKPGEYDEPDIAWPFNAYSLPHNNPERLKPHLKKRIWVITSRMINKNIGNRFLRAILLGIAWLARGRMTNSVHRLFLESLKAHKLYPKNESRVK
jgi:hypothetical protein